VFVNRGKKELTVSQLADALQTLIERRIEGLMTQKQLLELADRLAHDIMRTQQRNLKARISARRRRVQELSALGIRLEKLILCDQCSL
jgi:hypothetical protein